jgi:hypothetical protein
MSVEVEWPKITRDRAPSHDGGSMIWLSALIWDWARKLRVGKWRILDGKVESGLMSDSELLGDSPLLCRLRTASVGPCGTNIDYVLTHAGFMGSHKPSSFYNYLVEL